MCLAAVCVGCFKANKNKDATKKKKAEAKARKQRIQEKKKKKAEEKKKQKAEEKKKQQEEKKAKLTAVGDADFFPASLLIISLLRWAVCPVLPCVGV